MSGTRLRHLPGEWAAGDSVWRWSGPGEGEGQGRGQSGALGVQCAPRAGGRELQRPDEAIAGNVRLGPCGAGTGAEGRALAAAASST